MAPTVRQRASDAVWAAEDLPAHAKLVALALVRFVDNDTGITWSSVRTLRTDTGLSNDAVARAVRALRDRGFIVEVEPARGRRAARYRVVPEAISAPERGAQQQHDDDSSAERCAPIREGLRSDRRSRIPTREPLLDGPQPPESDAGDDAKRTEQEDEDQEYSRLVSAHFAAIALVEDLGLDIDVEDFDALRPIEDAIVRAPEAEHLALLVAATKRPGPRAVRNPVGLALRRLEAASRSARRAAS